MDGGWRVEGADAAVGTRDACEMTPFSNEGRPEVVNMMNDRINHDAAALSCTVAHRCSPRLNCIVHCIFRVFASFRDRNAQSRLPDSGPGTPAGGPRADVFIALAIEDPALPAPKASSGHAPIGRVLFKQH